MSYDALAMSMLSCVAQFFHPTKRVLRSQREGLQAVIRLPRHALHPDMVWRLRDICIPVNVVDVAKFASVAQFQVVSRSGALPKMVLVHEGVMEGIDCLLTHPRRLHVQRSLLSCSMAAGRDYRPCLGGRWTRGVRVFEANTYSFST